MSPCQNVNVNVKMYKNVQNVNVQLYSAAYCGRAGVSEERFPFNCYDCHGQ